MSISVLTLTGCDGGDRDEAADEGPSIVQGAAPGEQPTTLSEDELDDLETPAHTDADISFMQGMILHHQQALDMTALVNERTDRDDIPLLARRLEISQRDEIAQMERWLEARGADTTHHGEHDHASHLPGMLTAAELTALRATSGAAFDRLFLQSMIRHHAGAIAMVERLQADGGGQEPQISVFTDHVVADQGVEISRMTQLLSQLD